MYARTQFLALSHCQSSESGSIITETCSDCKPGEVCDTLDDGTSLCQKKECHFNCTDEKKHICGSNGITYKNQCELEKARCELNTDIDIEYSDECECELYVWYVIYHSHLQQVHHCTACLLGYFDCSIRL